MQLIKCRFCYEIGCLRKFLKEITINPILKLSEQTLSVKVKGKVKDQTIMGTFKGKMTRKDGIFAAMFIMEVSGNLSLQGGWAELLGAEMAGKGQ